MSFRVVDLRELNGERFLESEAVSDQILAPLMRLKNHREAIRRILATIATLDARDHGDFSRSRSRSLSRPGS